MYFNDELFHSGSPKQSPSRQNSRDSVEEEMEYIYDDDGTKSRNPVRRSNSSPEMSASWKNPFLHQKVTEGEDNQTSEEDSGKKNKLYSKDMRVSCEAIPEEIAGLGNVMMSRLNYNCIVCLTIYFLMNKFKIYFGVV